jgi:2-polyprenyl-6-methoxyphenol hydroxylase-like FAD-dependent oxidoreductase
LGDRLTEKFSVWVVGAGYVGLVTGACLAHVGHRVTLVDTNAGRVAELKAGRVHIYEPGLGELLAGCTDRLRFSTEIVPAAREARRFYSRRHAAAGGRFGRPLERGGRGAGHRPDVGGRAWGAACGGQ